MRQRDPSIKLIGWGDRGTNGLWAPELLKRAGEHIDMVAMHMMGAIAKTPGYGSERTALPEGPGARALGGTDRDDPGESKRRVTENGG